MALHYTGGQNFKITCFNCYQYKNIKKWGGNIYRHCGLCYIEPFWNFVGYAVAHVMFLWHCKRGIYKFKNIRANLLWQLFQHSGVWLQAKGCGFKQRGMAYRVTSSAKNWSTILTQLLVQTKLTNRWINISQPYLSHS